MPIIDIKPARREGSHVLVSFTGPSGSGKTMTAIKVARGLIGLQGRLGFLDTETGRGRLYSDLTAYDYGELTPPFSPTRFIGAIDDFEAHGVDALILDSASHEWEGVGGVQEMAEATGKQGLLKWQQPKAAHKRFVNRLLTSRMHIFICLRAREKMIQAKDERGRDQIVSDGYHEIQEKNFIYEMTASVLLLPGGRKLVTKCPAALQAAFGPVGQESVGYLDEGTGRMLGEWVKGGDPVDQAFEAMKRTATKMAETGVEGFREWWKRLPPTDRDRLKPQLANLQSIAEEADRVAGLGADQLPDGTTDDDFPGTRA
ncbi:AAA family ATPase [Azospirillum rugosum]|uniref:AAA domain-containing protein n=1 Tax=Azospirillum rugosum TaxID=416170 RepID=A0ABS4SDV5_9PROT|nr:AAA family ATPase [Azospirillum rugosum]MBP2290763.1 hypothetical protein [Azospirillum rugosum]MDQ0525652.1 hypothetical protein [Azospirillum rugosum]